MLHGSQKRFDKNGDGKLKGAEWQRWYQYAYGNEIEAKEKRRRANAAAEQKRAQIAADFADHVSDLINWMYHDLAHLEGEREDQAIRTMHLALYVISAALQTQKTDESMRYLLRAFWNEFQPTLDESVYQALCTKQVLFAEIGEISEKRLGSFWRNLLDNLPPERRIGKDDDLQELLDDTNRLYNYFCDDSAPEIDFAKELEPYWAAIRLPEEPEEAEEYDEDEEPEEESEPWADFYEKSAPAEKSTSGGYYQFCKVQFKDGGSPYAYLTGGLPLAVGDFVVVPVGNRNAEKTGRVTDVFVCSAQDAPYPPEKAKFVLWKAEPAAFPEKPKAQPVKEEPPAAPVQVKREESSAAPVQLKQEEPPAARPAPVSQAKPTSEPEIPKKHIRIPWKGLLVTAAIATVLIFALPPLLRAAKTNRQQFLEQQAEEEARLEARRQEEERLREAERQDEERERLEKEAAAKEQQRKRNVAIHKQKRAGLPYIGMSESSINSTQTLGRAGTAETEQRYEHDWQGNVKTVVSVTYTWYTENRKTIFRAVCEDGKVVKTQQFGGGTCWDGYELLVSVVKPEPLPPQTFNYGGSTSPDTSLGPGSTGLRDEYDSPEDLYGDNPWDYEDEDEAWDAWEND